MNLRIVSITTLAVMLIFSVANPSNANSATVVAAASQSAIDNGDHPEWWNPSLPEDIQKNVTNKGKNLADRLDLDEEKTKVVAALVSEHYGRVWAWHKLVDEKLDAAWEAWDDARGGNGNEKDELKALTIMTEQIDPIYAEFAPQIKSLLSNLREEIGEEKTTQLIDRITRSPGAPRTYNAYCEMVPQMTEEEKAVLWNRMVQAREDALAAWSGGRIIKIFKKYKIRNEFSLDYFGYGYKKHYKAWIKSKNN